jgi:hypothetical protein
MRTLSLPIDEWTAATVERLVTDEHVESLTLEFKRELPFASATDKAEVAKDVSAMANLAGGLIVYGIEEREGKGGVKIAGRGVPLIPGKTVPPDAAHWLDDVIAGLVVPRPSVRVRALATKDDGVYVVVRVAPSVEDLHMVRGRFYRRTEQAARPMSEPEVRDRYALISRRKDTAKEHVAEVVERELSGVPDPAFLLLLIPHTTRDMIDPSSVTRNDEALQHHDFLHEGLRPFADGVQLQAGEYRLRILRDGSVTSVFRPGLDLEGKGPTLWSPYWVLRELLSTLAIARTKWPTVSIVAPATLALHLVSTGTLKMTPQRDDAWNTLRRPTVLDLIGSQRFEIDVRPDDLQDNPLRIARAMMDRVFQASGVQRCGAFLENGDLTEHEAKNLKDQIAALRR